MIELLVVVSIVSLLIALLLPALGRARGAARTAACLSNLHQIGIALNAYLVEQRDTFPATRSWADLLGKAGDPVKNPSNFYGANHLTYADRPLNPYVRDPLVARCPSDRGDAYDSFNAGFSVITNCYESYGNSYQAPFSYDVLRTAFVMGRVGGSRSKRYHELAESYANKVVQGDFVWWGNRPIENPKSWWHNDGTTRKYNILFADWHAELFHFPYDQQSFWPAPDPPPDPANPWW